MKSGKKPTRAERECIQSAGLNSDHWLIYKKTHEALELVHRETGTTKTVYI
jgi:hypothetical protein